MKKIFLSLLLAPALLALTACHPDVLVTDIFLEPTAKTLFVGESFDLQVEYMPENATNADEMQIYSTNEQIVTYANGKVTANDGGSAAITVSCGNAMAQCRVKVYRYKLEKGGNTYGIDQAYGYLLMMGEASVQALQLYLVHNAADGSSQNFQCWLRSDQLGTDIDFTRNAGEAQVSVYANNNEDGYTIYFNEEEGCPRIVTADWSDTDATLTRGILRVDPVISNQYIIHADFELSNGYRFSTDWNGPFSLKTG